MIVQHVWGWLIAIYLFLGGMGGATAVISYYFYAIRKDKEVAGLGALTAFVLVVLGVLCLIGDLEKPELFYLALLSFQTSSWIFIGTVILSGMMLFTVFFAAPLLRPFQWVPWGRSEKALKALGFLSAAFGFLTITYTGILLSVLKAVPFWNSPALPLLFVLSALATGFALMVILNVVLSRRVTAMERAKFLSYCTWLSNWGAIAAAGEMFTLAVYYYTMSQGPLEARKSVEMMLFGPLSVSFYAYLGFVLLGALIAYFRKAFSPKESTRHPIVRLCLLSIADSILIIMSGLLLRHIILEAGVMTEFLNI